MSTREPERLLTFEIAGHIYALPIDGILEVAEGSEPSVVPTLSAAHAGVMNWHGEALPVVAGQMLLGATSPRDGEPTAALASGHVLVISDRRDEVPRLGLPVDAVLGLVHAVGPSRSESGSEVVIERCSIDGRVLSVLDPQRLIERAREMIEDMAA